MQTTAVTMPAAAATPPAVSDPRAGGGVQGAIGDMLRGSGAGYAAATRQVGVQADKAAIHPFESVSTATNLLKQKTSGIPVVGKATSILHTIGGFVLLIASANASGTLRAPGTAAFEMGSTLADMIDGRKTSPGFSIGWGLATDPQTGEQQMTQSGVGAALASLGAGS